MEEVIGALRNLTQGEIDTLQRNGSTAENWERVRVSKEFDANRVWNTQFIGDVSIGKNSGKVTVDGLERPCGIRSATIANCTIGNNVFIANVGSFIGNYDIEDDVVIEDVSVMVSEATAQFGNGEEVNVLNETGGRSVTLFEELNAQIAYVQAFYRHDKKFGTKLDAIIRKHTARRHSGKGRLSKGAQVRSCKIIKNVSIGPSASLQGALELRNGTILSCSEHPTQVGAGVVVRDFILSEGSSVEEGAILNRAFVGQGVQVGKQCSVVQSLLFANCEAFHTEINSVFAGPYTVTHHKSTLLIASLWSFFNAGSGTNQSNHMYKLGPVHQGVFERGCKTGSFAYNLMECHIPAFCVIIGKHMANIDIPDFPFSYLYEDEGRSYLAMGVNLFSIGTVRDGEKWPERDRRKAPQKRDLIVFDVFSPYTVEKMRRGRGIIQELYAKTPREEEWVLYNGVFLKRILLKKGIRYYTMAIDRYLIGRFMEKIEGVHGARLWADLQNACRPKTAHRNTERWTDVGGLIALSERIDHIVKGVSEEQINTVDELLTSFRNVYNNYRDDEWRYICCVFEQEYGALPWKIGPQKATELLNTWVEAASGFNALILENTRSEFSDLSQVSYGLDRDDGEKVRDFKAVRGSFDTHPVVKNLLQEKERIKKHHEKLLKIVKKYS
jgi:carbonic anhydrase/acetyltransferase-like protein (isoleucine patch superfamily)